MKLMRILLMALVAFSIVPTSAFAGDFDWIRDFNVQAQADPSGFKARLATRFHLGDVEVQTVLSNCDSFADAYLMLRLGEMSGRPTSYVVEKYRVNKEKGWGALSKSLGIKAGSEEFHALKRGHDLRGDSIEGQLLYSSYRNDHVNTVDVGHGKGGGKGKGKKKQ